jgi:hypothetical protein
MSTHYLSVCWKIELQPSPKLVLISLADQANDDGVCWPSVRTIGRRTGLSPRRISYWIGWLEKKKLLRRKIRAGHSSLLELTPAAGSTMSPATPLPSAAPTPVASDTPTPVASDTQNHHLNLQEPGKAAFKKLVEKMVKK